VPSVAPLAQTSETNVSSSPHRTVSVPITTRKADAVPGSPFGPGGPAGPGDPACPCGPCGPAGPCGPGVGCPHPASDIATMIMAKTAESCRIEDLHNEQQLALTN